MYFNDHTPSHFHAKYNEFRASMDISSLSVLDGKLPPRIHGLVIEWGEYHQDELISNSKTIRETGDFRRIEPLV